MAEYIERSAVLQNKTTMTEYDEGGWDAPVSVVRVADIEAIPSADVAPVVRGRWGEYEVHPLAPSLNGYPCTVCGQHEQRKTNCCPNCGAKMDLED